MKRINNIFLMLAWICLLTGCMKEEMETPQGNAGSNKMFDMRLNMTRAAANSQEATDEEMNVGAAYVYIFNAEGKLENPGRTKVEGSPILKSIDGSTDQLNDSWKVREGNKSIYVIFNPKNLTQNLDTWEPTSATDVKALVTTVDRAAGIRLFNGVTEGQTKLMTGSKENIQVTGLSGTGTVEIPIERRYAALELQLKKEPLLSTSTVIIKKVEVSNITWQSIVFERSPLWTDGKTDQNAVISNTNMSLTIGENLTPVLFAKETELKEDKEDLIINPKRFYMSPRPASVSKSNDNVPRIEITADVDGKEVVYYAYITELIDGQCDLSKPLDIKGNSIYRIQATLTRKAEDLHITLITLPWNMVPEQEEEVHPGTLKMTNCFIATPGEMIAIPVQDVYKIWNWELNKAIPADAEIVPEIIWMDTEGLIASVDLDTSLGDKDYSRIKVRTAPGKNGNALIGMKVGGETTYRWSWHVWVPEDMPESVTFDNVEFMDRNLGALEIWDDNSNRDNGLLYQWGRKDPFPVNLNSGSAEPILYGKYTSVTKVAAPITETNNLAVSIENPVTYYTSVDDWYGQSYHNNMLWAAQKTIYDPCPKNWRMATHSEFQKIIDSYDADENQFMWSGVLEGGYRHLDTGLFIPACGVRSQRYGAIGSIGSNGWYWSSSTQDNSGKAYSFYDGSMNAPNRVRAYGHGVRCVRDID